MVESNATLPTIPVTAVRELNIDKHPEGRASHLGAASGVVRSGNTTYVIADDELYLGVFGEENKPGHLDRILPGTLPLEPKARKKAKPDFEALVKLPPTNAYPNGALLGLGSGSKKHRDRGFLWQFDANGTTTGKPQVIDLGPLYRDLQSRIPGKLNIEGSIATAETLTLFQRGNSADGKNMTIELQLSDVIHEMKSNSSISANSVGAIHSYDLGNLNGVPLTFADARAIDGGRSVFLASAEATKDATEDGAVMGSAVGVIEANGKLGPMWQIDAKGAKLEGVELLAAHSEHAVTSLNPGTRLMFVTDADDPAKAAQVLVGSIPVAN